MNEITIKHLCMTYPSGNKDLLLCECFVNAKPEYTAQQVIARINNRISTIKKAAEQRHWSYDPNLLIAIKQLSSRLETNLKGYLK